MKLWQNFKTCIGTKLKNSNWDKTQHIGTKQIELICDKTQKQKLRQNSKTKIRTKLNKNSNFDKITRKKSNYGKTQKLKLWNRSKTEIVFKKKLTKLENSNCEKSQKLKLWQNSKTKIVKEFKTQMVKKNNFFFTKL